MDAIPRLPPADSYAVSAAQRRMWILSQLEGGSAAHTIALALRLDGPLDVAALQRAFAALVARHESLRTRFVDIDGEPRQIVDESAEGRALNLIVEFKVEGSKGGPLPALSPSDEESSH